MRYSPAGWVNELFIKEVEECAHLFCENCGLPCAGSECPIESLGKCLHSIMTKREFRDFLSELSAESSARPHDPCIENALFKLRATALGDGAVA